MVMQEPSREAPIAGDDDIVSRIPTDLHDSEKFVIVHRIWKLYLRLSNIRLILTGRGLRTAASLKRIEDAVICDTSDGAKCGPRDFMGLVSCAGHSKDRGN